MLGVSGVLETLLVTDNPAGGPSRVIEDRGDLGPRLCRMSV